MWQNFKLVLTLINFTLQAALCALSTFLLSDSVWLRNLLVSHSELFLSRHYRVAGIALVHVPYYCLRILSVPRIYLKVKPVRFSFLLIFQSEAMSSMRAAPKKCQKQRSLKVRHRSDKKSDSRKFECGTQLALLEWLQWSGIVYCPTYRIVTWLSSLRPFWIRSHNMNFLGSFVILK